MAVGKSGRLVIEMDADAKKRLHESVKRDGMTMKEWFEKKAREDYPDIFPDDPEDGRAGNSQ